MDTNIKILCVDDEPNVLDAFKRQLRGKFNLEVCNSPQRALELLQGGERFSVIVSDMRMPGMDGISFLKQAQERSPHSVRVMLTGNADQATVSQAINQGNVFRFLNKPCSPEQMEQVLNASVEQYKLIHAEKELLQKTLSGSVKLLSDVLSMSDPSAFGQSAALREPLKKAAEIIGLSNVWELELAVMLAPIGWVAVSDDVRTRHRSGEPLSPAEREQVLMVPTRGRDLIRNIPRLENVAKIIQYTRKHYDGTGTPLDNIKGEEIPLGARLIRIVQDMVQLETTGIAPTAALKALLVRKGVYDSAIIQKLMAHATQTGQQTEAPLHYEITAKELCVGHRLMANLLCNDGRLLLNAGTYVSELLLESIQNYANSTGLKAPILVDQRIPTLNSSNQEN